MSEKFFDESWQNLIKIQGQILRFSMQLGLYPSKIRVKTSGFCTQGFSLIPTHTHDFFDLNSPAAASPSLHYMPRDALGGLAGQGFSQPAGLCLFLSPLLSALWGWGTQGISSATGLKPVTVRQGWGTQSIAFPAGRLVNEVCGGRRGVCVKEISEFWHKILSGR